MRKVQALGWRKCSKTSQDKELKDKNCKKGAKTKEAEKDPNGFDFDTSSREQFSLRISELKGLVNTV